MPQCSQLPLWVSYAQALTVPIIAILGVWIAARQMVIAHDKFELDAFDRQYEKRVAVYEATRKFLASVFHGSISDDDIRVYGLCTLDAQFLFDEKLYSYLKEIRQRVGAWTHAKCSIEQLPPGDERNEYERIKKEYLNWIIQQGDETTGFATRFVPFLVHMPAKRAWWLRWPM
jgi:hypothetical protein